MTNRGVKSTWLGKKLGYTEEKVCLCHCHELCSTVRHFVGCCHEPKTEAGTLLLECYNDELSIDK